MANGGFFLFLWYRKSNYIPYMRHCYSINRSHIECIQSVRRKTKLSRQRRNPLKVISDIINLVLYTGLILVIAVFVGGYALDSFYGSSSSLPSGEKIEQNGSTSQISPTYASICDEAWETDLYNSTKSTMETDTVSNPDDYSTWVQMPRSVIDAGKSMDMDELVRVWQYAIYDNPDLSIYATGGESSFLHSSGTSYAIDTPATKEEGTQEIQSKLDAAKSKAGEIADEAWDAAGGDTTEYIRRIYFWLVSNDTYDENPTSIHCNDLYGSIIEGRTQCYGFSNAIKYMCDMRNIPNFIASGRIPAGTAHAWNVIWSGEKWLVCDCTNGTAAYHESMEGMTLEQIQQNQRRSSELFAACLIDQGEFLKEVTMDEDSRGVEQKYESALKSRQWPDTVEDADPESSNANGLDTPIGNSGASSTGATNTGKDTIDLWGIIEGFKDAVAAPIRQSLHGIGTAMSLMDTISR